MNKTITKDKVVIMHGGCDDGIGGAFLFWQLFKDTADYYPGYYQDPAPDLTGKEVYIVDFSFPEEATMQIANTAKSLVWMDHHKSTEALAEKLKALALPTVKVMFDNARSGARLAFDYITETYGQTDPAYDRIKGLEEFTNYIQDNDLWQFKLAGSKRFSLALRSRRQQFEIWDKLDVGALIQEGASMELFYEAKVAEVCRLAYDKEIFGYNVPIVNCNGMFASDVGNVLAKGRPFSISWWYDGKHKTFVFSLRSDENGADVSELAAKVGGGGHARAAGFKLAPDKVDTILDLE